MKNVELGFNPTSKQKQLFWYTVTPEAAQHILDHHNNDNRPMTNSQVQSIVSNIRKNGWIMDGGALTFNVQGNITEFQHRLRAIVISGITVEVPVVLGVAVDSFTKTAAAKPRKAADEIMRKDRTATNTAITTCGEIVKRRQGKEKFNMNTAVSHWNTWKNQINKSESLIVPYEKIKVVSSYRRVFTAWATLMNYNGYSGTVTRFMELLEDFELRDKPTRLLKDYDRIMSETYKASPVERTAMLYKLLCLCSDRLQETPSGEVELGHTVSAINHERMRKTGLYRKFLENPDNIKL